MDIQAPISAKFPSYFVTFVSSLEKREKVKVNVCVCVCVPMKTFWGGCGQGKRSPFYIVCLLSKWSLFQDTVANLSSGPEPPFFEELMSPLIPNIVDRAPEGTTFGDILLPANPTYRVVRLGKGCWDPYEAYT